MLASLIALIQATGELLTLNRDPRPAASGVRRAILCLPSGPADELETCTLFFIATITAATSRLWIASPCFVPDEQFITVTLIHDEYCTAGTANFDNRFAVRVARLAALVQ